jgi:valyl-tRNA synthetase
VRYSLEKVRQGQALTNKLWNASRLVLLRVEDVDGSEPRPETVEDRWILSRLERATERITALYESFELSRAALDLYDVFWNEFCDWFLELAKPRLYDEDADRAALSATLLWALERVLVLMHPIMPFVTEEVWSHLPGERGLLAAHQWPEVDPERIDEDAEAVLGRTIDAVTALRRYRDEVGVPAASTLRGRLAAEGYGDTVEQVARLARFELDGADANGDPLASVAVPGGAVQVLASEAIDSEGLERRRSARRAELEHEIARAEGKLQNERFVEGAPGEVVDAEREKLARFREELERLG